MKYPWRFSNMKFFFLLIKVHEYKVLWFNSFWWACVNDGRLMSSGIPLLLREVLQVLLQVGFWRPQVPDEDLGTRKTNLQQPYRSVAENERDAKLYFNTYLAQNKSNVQWTNGWINPLYTCWKNSLVYFLIIDTQNGHLSIYCFSFTLNMTFV